MAPDPPREKPVVCACGQRSDHSHLSPDEDHEPVCPCGQTMAWRCCSGCLGTGNEGGVVYPLDAYEPDACTLCDGEGGYWRCPACDR